MADDILYIDITVAVYVECVEIDVVHCLTDRGADCDDDILYVDLTVAVSVAENALGGIACEDSERCEGSGGDQGKNYGNDFLHLKMLCLSLIMCREARKK